MTDPNDIKQHYLWLGLTVCHLYEHMNDDEREHIALFSRSFAARYHIVPFDGEWPVDMMERWEALR